MKKQKASDAVPEAFCFLSIHAVRKIPSAWDFCLIRLGRVSQTLEIFLVLSFRWLRRGVPLL